MPDPIITLDPAALAAEARSILACPSSVELVVRGVPDLLTGEEDLGMDGNQGEPVFACGSDTRLARASARNLNALVKVASGLGPPGSADRGAVLTIAGRLETRGREHCPCCVEERDVVALAPDFVLLERQPDGPDAGRLPLQQYRVPLAEFRSPAHLLNRGYLQRTAAHANDCHQDELRRAVSRLSGSDLAEIAGAGLGELRPAGATLRWLDRDGAHEVGLRFSRAARTAEDLAALLRGSLGEPIC